MNIYEYNNDSTLWCSIIIINYESHYINLIKSKQILKDQKKKRKNPTNLAHQSFQSRSETTPISKSSGPFRNQSEKKAASGKAVLKRCNNGRPINRPAPRHYQKNSISDDVIVWRRIIDLNPPKKSDNTYIRIYIYV